MKKVILLPLCFYSMLAQGVVSYSLQENEENHKVLSLGDFHGKELNTINEGHVEVISEFLEKCVNPNKPIKIYLEGKDSKLHNKELVTVHSIVVFNERLQKLKKEKKGLDFDFYEPRKNESDLLNGLMNFFDLKLHREPDCFAKKGFSRFNDFKVFVQNMKNDPLSIGIYLKTLARDEQRLKKWRDKFPEFSCEFKLFDKKYSLFVQSKNKIMHEFENQEPKKSLALAFFEFIEKDGIEDILKRFKLLYTLILRESDFIVADAGFLKKFLEEKKTNQNVIFFTGLAHQRALSKDIEALSYKTVASEFAGTKVNDYGTYYLFKPNFINSIIGALACCMAEGSEHNKCKVMLQSLASKKEVNLSTSNCVTPTNDTPLRKCDFCSKRAYPSQSLLRCSRCKQVHYCSVNCQAKAWPEHQKNCK